MVLLVVIVGYSVFKVAFCLVTYFISLTKVVSQAQKVFQNSFIIYLKFSQNQVTAQK